MALVSSRVAVHIAIRLQPLMVEVTPVDDRILGVKMKHTLGLTSLTAVFTPEMC